MLSPRSVFSLAVLGLWAMASAADPRPVTDKPVNNAAGVFHFAVLPDRQGGNRPGVFEAAIAKLNLLQPEFVVSTGDLIDGYTLDPKVWTAQWEEFDRLVNQLEMPFHYVPGNHDISNPLMLEVWKQRHGQPWSSFVHENVLFLTLHTEDRPLGGLGAEQIAWAKETLAAHAGVRWTFVLMHRALWRQGNQAGFEQVREVLKERPFTAFSSHDHVYLKSSIDGQAAYSVATAGGVSPLRGADFGEFDHVTWVTMKPTGPVIANLALSGILGDDVVTEAGLPFTRELRNGSWLHIAPVLHESTDATRLEIPLELHNPTDQPLRVRGSLARTALVEFVPPRIDRTVAPGQILPVPVQLRATKGATTLHALNEAGIELTLTGSYEVNGKTLTLPATRTLRFDSPHRAPAPATPVVLDGDLAEWPAELFTAVERPMVIREDWDWHGPDDGRFRFAVQAGGGRVHVAVETTDERVITSASRDELQDKLIVTLRTSAGAQQREVFAGQADEQVNVRATATGLVAEFSFQLPADDTSFHLNLGWLDHDHPESTKASLLWWRDPAVGEFGKFVLP